MGSSLHFSLDIFAEWVYPLEDGQTQKMSTVPRQRCLLLRFVHITIANTEHVVGNVFDNLEASKKEMNNEI